jgi:hypothetical protein
MTIKYIIARYQEDVSWANGVPNCIIYNKSDSPPNTIHPVISLPNVGREGHTYLHHIITNYDQLDDYTVFLQGTPWDHSPHLEQTLTNLEYEINHEKKDISFKYISEHFFNTTIKKEEYLLTSISYYILFGPIKFKNMYPNDKSLLFGGGAQFIVSKNTILSRPKSFYEKMITLLDYDSNPVEGHAIERLWNTIFTHSE